MKVVIGSDHRGYEHKEKAKAILEGQSHSVIDIGTHNTEPCDYPRIAHKLAVVVSRGEAERGILICKSGIGMSIVANKTKGIRAALCHNSNTAKLARQHNDANVLVLTADDLSDPLTDVIQSWLLTAFEGGRHQRRLDQIKEIENDQCK